MAKVSPRTVRDDAGEVRAFAATLVVDGQRFWSCDHHHAVQDAAMRCARRELQQRQRWAEGGRRAAETRRARGVRSGRPSRIPVETRRLIVELRKEHSLRGVAAELNARGVPTVGGGPWRESSVRRVLQVMPQAPEPDDPQPRPISRRRRRRNLSTGG